MELTFVFSAGTGDTISSGDHEQIVPFRHTINISLRFTELVFQYLDIIRTVEKRNEVGLTP